MSCVFSHTDKESNFHKCEPQKHLFRRGSLFFSWICCPSKRVKEETAITWAHVWTPRVVCHHSSSTSTSTFCCRFRTHRHRILSALINSPCIVCHPSSSTSTPTLLPVSPSATNIESPFSLFGEKAKCDHNHQGQPDTIYGISQNAAKKKEPFFFSLSPWQPSITLTPSPWSQGNGFLLLLPISFNDMHVVTR